jgi:HK97 family phage major capsid protein
LSAKREERAKLVKQARDVWGKAEQEKRELTALENEQVTKLLSDADRLESEFKAEEGQTALRSRLTAHEADCVQSRGRKVPAELPPGSPAERRAQKGYGDMFRRWLTAGDKGMSAELRALQVDSDILGGYLMAPQQFVAEVIQTVTDAVFARQYARVFPLSEAVSLGAPKLTTRPSAALWTSELTQTTDDTAARFGKRELFPHFLTKEIKVSRPLLEKAAVNMESWISGEFARIFAETEENAFLNGSGANQPLGVFTASTDGVSTGRDFSTGNSTTAISADGLIGCYYSMKQQHRRSSRWLFNRVAVRQIRQLKDGDGQYIWLPGIRSGEDDTILGRPVDESEFAPSTFTAGLYVGLLANWQAGYWIADVAQMGLQRLDELYARTNEIGFIGRRWVDGAPVLEEAFARVTLAP